MTLVKTAMNSNEIGKRIKRAQRNGNKVVGEQKVLSCFLEEDEGIQYDPARGIEALALKTHAEALRQGGGIPLGDRCFPPQVSSTVGTCLTPGGLDRQRPWAELKPHSG